MSYNYHHWYDNPRPLIAVSDEELDRELTDDELYSSEHGRPWCSDPETFDDFSFQDETVGKNEELTQILPSQFTEFAFRMPKVDGVGYENFSFTGREHMRRVYDTPAKRVLLFCGRQVEKCGALVASMTLANGAVVLARDIRVGQRVPCLDTACDRFTTGEVTWVSTVQRKPCVRIRTRQGHVLEVARTHPIRTWDAWTEAERLEPGFRVAAIRRAGEFGRGYVHPDRIEMTAFMLGDGGTTQPTFTFTNGTDVVKERFSHLLRMLGHTARSVSRKGATQFFIHHEGPLYDWMREDGLAGKYSFEKGMPAWVFDLDREGTALLLNRLWSTDGHARRNTRSKYSLEYCSTSKILAQQIQSLLWKFGIPTSRRENQPSYRTKKGRKTRLAYILRIETQEGVRAFLQQVGALGKSESVPLPATRSNNNRDTYPLEVNDLLRQIIRSNPRPRSGRAAAAGSLRSAGLRETLKYPPTAGKLQDYVQFFRSDGAYDPALVEKLSAQLGTDVYWDEVESVEDLGVLDCVDFEVAQHHNFPIDGVVTHNSTLLGNRIVTYSCMVPSFRTLYVSPSSTQTKTFSADRIKEPMETSDVLRSFTTTLLQQNVFEKQFVNRSKITLRFAFLNADRTRGIPTWLLALDELQDILPDNIPVIEQSASHAPPQWRRFLYAGTPKGLDNVIEYYRSGTSKGRPMSTMGEWVVPCDRCGSNAEGAAGRYWNILGEKNIQRSGLSCERCGQRINPMHPDSQWASMQSDGIFESYRIPQLMVPWRPWEEIMLDYGRYDRARFYNEVLGISYDSGLRPLTKQQVKECCNPEITMHPSALEHYKQLGAGQPIFAGLDWGTGENSYTVLVLATYVNQKFRVFYIHRFTGEDVDPVPQLEKICEMISYFNVRLIGADYGGGFDKNDHLVRKFGPKRLQKYQYLPQRAKKKVFWNPQFRRWQIVRTECMSDIFNAIKRKQFEFPRWEEFEDPYSTDMTNIFSEYNESLRMTQYTHGPGNPDDSFHALLTCFFVSMLAVPRPDIVSPIREIPGQGPLRSWYRGPMDQGSE